MAFKNIFKSYKEKKMLKAYAKMLSGGMPVFSQFGNDIYASDVVNNCIRSIATEMGKLEPKHIRTTNDIQTTVNSSINRLLRFGPNEFMTTKDFLEKCTWIYEKNYNCFIYPKYDIKEVNGGTVRYYTGFYPLNPTEVDFLEDTEGKIYIKFYFGNGENYTLPYSDIIHWRKDFGDNDIMGGDELGRPKNKDILKVLKINHTITEGLEKAVKSSLSIRGLLRINTLLDDEKQEEERKKFEQKLLNSQSGLLPIDLKQEYIPIDVDPKIIDKDTLEFIERKILNHHGVSLAIINGDFTDEQYQAFYEKKLETNIIALGQAFSKTLFTNRELEHGNEVIFYGQKLLFTNTKNKIAVADILGNRGALTDNQLLAIFGYPPFEGGDVRHMSLNFINRDIADNYQMNKHMNELSVVRSFNVADFRTTKDEKFNVEGHAAVFNQTTTIGNWFYEVIERGAFDECDFDDVLFFVNHNMNKIPMARSRRNNGNSTMKLEVDDVGLLVKADLDIENNSEARTLHSSISRGDIDGMSFAFRIKEQTWENLDTDMPTRKIKKIAKVYEVSAVNNPAYTQTDINARDKEALENAKNALDNARSTELDNSNALEIEKLRTQILMKG